MKAGAHILITQYPLPTPDPCYCILRCTLSISLLFCTFSKHLVIILLIHGATFSRAYLVHSATSHHLVSFLAPFPGSLCSYSVHFVTFCLPFPSSHFSPSVDLVTLFYLFQVPLFIFCSPRHFFFYISSIYGIFTCISLFSCMFIENATIPRSQQ